MSMATVEAAIRRSVHEGQTLRTPAEGATFMVGELRSDAVVLILGNGHDTPIPWSSLEGVLPFLAGKGWVPIGMVFAPSDEMSTFDGYMKSHVNRATANYVARLLEEANVVEIDRGRPARVRLARFASDTGPRTFDTLEAALSAWGKYNGSPYKVQVALDALRRLVEVKGTPPNPDSNGDKPFYIVDGGQYVAARWNGSIGLSFQAGFITGRSQLTSEWVPSSEDVKNAKDWWRYDFPDHVRFGKESESTGTRTARCTCSHSIGILQPIGSNCTYCDEVIT